MQRAGQELARHFAPAGATKVLTAEISGIAPAAFTALALGVPMIYARKVRPITMPERRSSKNRRRRTPRAHWSA